MHIKRNIGPIVAGVGIIVVIYSVFLMIQLSRAKKDVNNATRFFPSTLIGKNNKNSLQYDREILWCLGTGIVLSVVGGGITYLFRKK